MTESPTARPRTLSEESQFGVSESVDDLWVEPAKPRTLEIIKEIQQLKVMCISTPEGGHLVPMVQVAIALAERQHEVQVVTCAWAGTKMAERCRKSGCTFVGVAEHVQGAETGQGRAAELAKAGMPLAMFFHYNDEMKAEVRAHMEQWRPDIVVADFITPCAWDVADELNIRVVVNFPGPLDFLSKWSPLAQRKLRPVWKKKFPPTEVAALERITTDMMTIRCTRPCLVHTFFGLENPMPVMPNIIVTGSVAPRNCSEAGETSMPLFNDWLEAVRAQGLQIVYVTMGSMQVLEEYQVEAFYNGLREIPGIAVAWSLKENQQAFLPEKSSSEKFDKFFVNKWMPQAEALQLPEVCVVMTHCGWGGLNETICAGKPIVATPFRADQPVNAAVARRQGMAELINMASVTAADVQKTVTKVVRDPSYKAAAKRMQDALLKTGGAELCAESIENWARNGFDEVCSEPVTLEDEVRTLMGPAVHAAFGAALMWLVPRVLQVAWPLGRNMCQSVVARLLKLGA
uniref:UDP-glycosyltransferases domain-containing protein n=1 Tax=Noctiluca scintillans TaxID=2966 RepID=A0A7S1EYL2_NOCSC